LESKAVTTTLHAHFKQEILEMDRVIMMKVVSVILTKLDMSHAMETMHAWETMAQYWDMPLCALIVQIQTLVDHVMAITLAFIKMEQLATLAATPKTHAPLTLESLERRVAGTATAVY